MCAHKQSEADQRQQRAGHQHEDCGPQCGAFSDQRNRYYTGKYMAARDFQAEQEYFLGRQRLHNRLMHGWGVVCGLYVRAHRADCPEYAVISSGIAIDCCGRELVVRKDTVVKVWEPTKAELAQERKSWPDTRTYLLYLHYQEEGTDCVPTLYTEDYSTNRLEANRIQEVARLAVIPWDDVNQSTYAGCWPEADVNLKSCSKGCGKVGETDAGCVESECLCSLGVPLALITVTRTGGENEGIKETPESEYRVTKEGIVVDGRPSLKPPKEYLTHIVRTNWPHGGEIPLTRLARYRNDKEAGGQETDMDGKLKIYFDRPLADRSRNEADMARETGAAVQEHGERGQQWEQKRKELLACSGGGINNCTFIVEVHDIDEDRVRVKMLVDDDYPPYWNAEECAAIFPIEDELLEGRDAIVNRRVRVMLKCDYVLDCNGLAVDGEYVRGKFPTGSGSEGGTFESWFFISDDGGQWRHYRQRARSKKLEEKQERSAPESAV